jgi:hypothetical protein
MGVVESVREVLMEGTKSPVGAVAGAAVGGVSPAARSVVAKARRLQRSLVLWLGVLLAVRLKKG